MEFSAPQMQGSTAASSLRDGLSVRAKPELAAAAETTIGTSALETLRSGAGITQQSSPTPVSPVQRTRFQPTSAFSPQGMEPTQAYAEAAMTVQKYLRGDTEIRAMRAQLAQRENAPFLNTTHKQQQRVLWADGVGPATPMPSPIPTHSVAQPWHDDRVRLRSDNLVASIETL